tara:strand:- start:565 stop:825 length:261 start_codon:yes stop_codon:yes gene_type:complete
VHSLQRLDAKHRLLAAGDAEGVAVANHGPGAGGCGTREREEVAHGVRERLADVLTGAHRIERKREIIVKTGPNRAVDENVIGETIA